MPSLMLCSHGAILLVAYAPRRNPRTKTDESFSMSVHTDAYGAYRHCLKSLLHQFGFILRTVSRRASIQCLRHPVVQRSSHQWMLGTDQNGSDSKTKKEPRSWMPKRVRIHTGKVSFWISSNQARNEARQSMTILSLQRLVETESFLLRVFFVFCSHFFVIFYFILRFSWEALGISEWKACFASRWATDTVTLDWSVIEVQLKSSVSIRLMKCKGHVSSPSGAISDATTTNKWHIWATWFIEFH